MCQIYHLNYGAIFKLAFWQSCMQIYLQNTLVSKNIMIVLTDMFNDLQILLFINWFLLGKKHYFLYI